MRFVLTLFDAPVPAQQAWTALRAVGFGREDLAVVSVPTWIPAPRPNPADPAAEDGAVPPSGAVPQGLPGFDRVSADGAAGLADNLAACGLDAATAALYGEAVRRGAILLALRAPTLSAPIAAKILAAAGPADLAVEVMRWHVDAHWRYGWADAAPPILGDG